MSSVDTVARIAPSMVISKTTIRFGHQATIGMLPVCSGQASSVMRVSQRGSRQADEAAEARDVPQPGGAVAVREGLSLERLTGHDDDIVLRNPGGMQPVHRALRRIGT